jgi:hypothetical protein
VKPVLVGQRTIRSSLLLTSLSAAIACTAYTPLQLGQAAAGYNVRVTLSDQGAVDLTPRIGARAVQLEGTLHEASDSSILLTVRRVTRIGGGDDNYDALDVPIPAHDIETVERSKTSVSRSLLTAGAIAATALLAARGVGDVSGGKNGGPPGSGK